MKSNLDYSIYLVTDEDSMTAATLPIAVDEAIKGGCTIVQLRDKVVSSLAFYNMAKEVREVTKKHDIPLIINDRIDIALAADADGVHVGQQDIPALKVRQLIGNDKILGVSVSSLEEAIRAQKDGADYLGVGAMFKTGTKKDARYVLLEELGEIRRAIDLPIVAIGGINLQTLPSLSGTKIDGIAVISAIIAQDNIREAAECLTKQFELLVKGRCEIN